MVSSFEKSRFQWWTWLLGVLALASRFCFRSAPYYVDGPRHAAAVASGVVFIQPPGYFLFGETARLIVLASGISPASALSGMNYFFSALGVVIFANIAIRIFPGLLGVLLSFFYAFSVTVWFVAEIHSTYAAMTFFAPALLYFILIEERWWVLGVLWAAMTGFRPSDGVFVFPFLLLVLLKRARIQMVIFACAAIPVAALWYIPTVQHFGGHLLSPLGSAGDQANSLANGLLVPGVSWKRKVGNLIHIAFGAFNAWNILTPFLLVGLFSKQRVSRYVLAWMVPGLLFFSLYFFSDSVYLTYMIAPGVLVAGEGLRRIPARAAVLTVATGLLVAVLQMTVNRPITPKTVNQSVVNSYCLQYSGWSIRHRYYQRLQDALGGLKEDAH